MKPAGDKAVPGKGEGGQPDRLPDMPERRGNCQPAIKTPKYAVNSSIAIKSGFSTNPGLYNHPPP
jgi:hypothetical protein